MAKCKYCGKSAGWFSSKHQSCENEHNLKLKKEKEELLKNENKAKQIIEETLTTNDAKNFKLDSEKALKLINNNQNFVIDIVVRHFREMINNALEDNFISKEEESKIGLFMNNTYGQSAFSTSDPFHLLSRGIILRYVIQAEGKFKNSFQDNWRNDYPIIFQKNEELIYTWGDDITLSEPKIKTEFRGGSTGVSFKVVRGLYIRKSAFKGKPIQTTHKTILGKGLFAITTKHLYFNSPQKSFRIQIPKIVSINTYSDAVIIQKEGVSAKPQTFYGVDGWFLQNVINNL